MDLVTVVAGVILGNSLTVAFLWNARKLDAPEPPVRNILIALAILGFAGLVFVAGAQNHEVGLSYLRR